jgi:hypothetical protein
MLAPPVHQLHCRQAEHLGRIRYLSVRPWPSGRPAIQIGNVHTHSHTVRAHSPSKLVIGSGSGEAQLGPKVWKDGAAHELHIGRQKERVGGEGWRPTTHGRRRRRSGRDC